MICNININVGFQYSLVTASTKNISNVLKLKDERSVLWLGLLKERMLTRHIRVLDFTLYSVWIWYVLIISIVYGSSCTMGPLKGTVFLYYFHPLRLTFCSYGIFIILILSVLRSPKNGGMGLP